MLVSGAAAVKPLQSCLTLCDPHRWQPTGLHCPWDSPGKNTGVGCHFLLHLSGEVFAKRTFLPITPLPMSQSLPPMQTWVPVLYGCGGWTCFFSPASYLPRWAGGLQLRTGKINKPSELSWPDSVFLSQYIFREIQCGFGHKMSRRDSWNCWLCLHSLPAL